MVAAVGDGAQATPSVAYGRVNLGVGVRF